MQNILPDFKICQEAAEKGIKIETDYFIGSDNKIYLRFDKAMVDLEQQVLIKKSFFEDDFEFYPAPLTDEILKVLPRLVFMEKVGDEFNVFTTANGLAGEIIKDKKLSNALLQLAIELKKNFINNI